MIKKNEYNIFGLSASQGLTNEVCRNLEIEQHIAKTTRFADGEILVQAKDSVRQKEVFVIQSTGKPVNENLMELLIALDAFKRASTSKINVVIPYFGYARQDRKSEGRQPITAKLVANLIQEAGADRVIIFDLHSAQTMGFFDIPVDNISSSLIMADEIAVEIIRNNYDVNECVLVSPDQGGLSRVHSLANNLQGFTTGVAAVAKRRPEPNKSEVEFVLGDVKNKICFLYDDMIDTGGTIINAAKALKADGAKKVYIYACHGLFNGQAKEKFLKCINEKIIEGIVVSNTFELPEESKFDGLKIVSIGSLMAEIIEATVLSVSLSIIFQNHKKKIKSLYLNYKKGKK
ncbi:ribose-phosphate diphosphokinase [Spiroplasma endosymbiont of Aspidapion aeneum]|uniref:ribose-phosphate diphosphokinase n=1 Tax=Spiroplasma endosymbiont of Aspidapion aeneum TaxID=3066276 RepID=UPI00313CCC27